MNKNENRKAANVAISISEVCDSEQTILSTSRIGDIYVDFEDCRNNLIRIGIIDIYRQKGKDADGTYSIGVAYNEKSFSVMVLIKDNKPLVMGVLKI